MKRYAQHRWSVATPMATDNAKRKASVEQSETNIIQEIRRLEASRTHSINSFVNLP